MIRLSARAITALVTQADRLVGGNRAHHRPPVMLQGYAAYASFIQNYTRSAWLVNSQSVEQQQWLVSTDQDQNQIRVA
jgi:hypothetical protein